MACDGYSKNALMGNWYEEREAIPQPYRENLDQRFKRESEDAISFITRNNELKPLERYNRVQPWNTSAVIVDDGYREWKTLNKTTYDPTLLSNYKAHGDCRPLIKTVEAKKDYPESHTMIQTSKPSNYTLLSDKNMQKQIAETKRDVKMNMTDFGSTFKKHNQDHDRFYMMSTYQQHFDRAEKTTPQQVIEKDGAKLTSFKGYTGRPDEQKGIKMTSTLTGEVFKQEQDPQQNTRVQRSWVPYVEGSIKAAEKNMKKNDEINTTTGFKTTNRLDNYRANNSQVLPYDIATSLPMGDGMSSLNSKYREPGTFRRITTDVTMIRNKPLTKR